VSSCDFEHAGHNAGGNSYRRKLHDNIAEQAETLEVRRLTSLSGRLYHSAKMAETVVLSTERLQRCHRPLQHRKREITNSYTSISQPAQRQPLDGDYRGLSIGYSDLVHGASSGLQYLWRLLVFPDISLEDTLPFTKGGGRF